MREQQRLGFSVLYKVVKVVQFTLRPAGGVAQLPTAGKHVGADVNKCARLPENPTGFNSVGLSIISDDVCVASSEGKMEDVKNRITEFSEEAHGQINTVSL